MRRAAPLDFQELARANDVARQSLTLELKGVALRSEDSAISSQVLSYTHCASNPEFEKLLQNIRGGLIEEDEWRRYG